MPQKLLAITYSDIFSGAASLLATSLPGTLHHSTEKILYNWKISQAQRGVSGRWYREIQSSYLTVCKPVLALNKGFTSLNGKGKDSFETCLNNSMQGALVVSWAESTSCSCYLTLQANSMQSPATS